MAKLTMENDEEIELSLAYGGLIRLEKTDPEIADSVFKMLNGVTMSDPKETFEVTGKIIYAAYLCVMYRAGEEPMGEDDFYDLLPDVTTCFNLAGELLRPNRKAASATHSGSTRTKQKTQA